MSDYIEKLQTLIKNNLDVSNCLLFKRQCKINFTDIFYYLIHISKSESASSTTVSSSMNIDNICEASSFIDVQHLFCIFEKEKNNSFFFY